MEESKIGEIENCGVTVCRVEKKRRRLKRDWGLGERTGGKEGMWRGVVGVIQSGRSRK